MREKKLSTFSIAICWQHLKPTKVEKYPTFHLFVLLLCSSSLLRESEKNRQHNTIGLLTFPKLGFSM